MDQSFLIANDDMIAGSGTARYVSVAGDGYYAATEAETECPIRIAGTLVSGRVEVKTNNNSSGNLVVTLRQNRTNTAISVTYTPGQTGTKDDADSVSVAATDELYWYVDNSAGNSGTTTRSCQLIYDVTGTYPTILFSANKGVGNESIISNTDYHCPLNGLLDNTNSELYIAYELVNAITFSDLYTYVISNAKTTDSVTFSIYIDGATGNNSVVYTAGQTGVKEDTSSTDAVSAASIVSILIDPSSNESATLVPGKVAIMGALTSGNETPHIAGGPAQSISAGVTRYIPISGGSTKLEADSTASLIKGATAENLFTYMSSNTSDGVIDYYIMDNGTQSSVTVQYAASQSGEKQDTTNTAAIATDQTIYFKIISSASTGSGNHTLMACTLDILPGSASFSPSVSPSQSPSASLSPSISPSFSSSISPSPSPSISPSPSLGWEGYSRGDYAALPSDDTDLETAYSVGDYTDVDTKNDVRVAQTAGAYEYAIHQFKDFVGGNTSCDLEWEGRSNYAPSDSTVVLQIYNQNSTTWENVDTDSVTAADTDFILSGNIADLTNYKTAGNTISCRVYQQRG